VKFPLFDAAGNVTAVCGIATDITDRKRTEKLLRDYSKTLEEDVNKRTLELKMAKDAAEAANRAKSTFLSNMSHELRTPLNAILGFSQIMGRSTCIKGKEKENLATIKRSAEHLLGLINSVLDMAAIEAGRMNLRVETFNLHRTLDILKEMLAITARPKQLRLHFHCDPKVPLHITSDEGKLRQVLINLIGNAIKFTEKGVITLSISAKDDPDYGSEGIRLRFEVSDTGLGIARDEIEHVFELFSQSGTTKHPTEGTGLGLAICREYVKLMGGDISIESEIGQGTTLSFEIRATRASSELVGEHTYAEGGVATIEPDQKAPDGRPYRILVIDDNTDNRNVLSSFLEDLGLEVDSAESGEDGLELFKKQKPHLVLMDLRMPGMDGYEARRRIMSASEKESIARPVVIAVTACVLDNEQRRVLKEFVDCVRKPFNESDILRMLSKHLGIRLVYSDISDKEDHHWKGKPYAPKEQIVSWLAALPEALGSELKASVELGNSSTIDQAISRIEELNHPLAHELSLWINDFLYDVLLEVIEEAEKRGDAS
jgi:signal transduction histidine kinase/FixJ family two-component response regulator